MYPVHPPLSSWHSSIPVVVVVVETVVVVVVVDVVVVVVEVVVDVVVVVEVLVILVDEAVVEGVVVTFTSELFVLLMSGFMSLQKPSCPSISPHPVQYCPLVKRQEELIEVLFSSPIVISTSSPRHLSPVFSREFSLQIGKSSTWARESESSITSSKRHMRTLE